MIEVKIEGLPEWALLMKEHLDNFQYIAPLFLDESEQKHAMERPDVPAEPVEKLTFENTVGGLFSAPNRDSQIGAINYLLNYTSSYNITLSGRKKRASSGAIDAPIGISHVQDGSDRDIFDREKPSKNFKSLQEPSISLMRIGPMSYLCMVNRNRSLLTTDVGRKLRQRPVVSYDKNKRNCARDFLIN